MTLQSSVAAQMGFGVVGELFSEGPTRSRPFTLDSADAAYNVMGRAFTVKSEGVAQAGGTGAFAGIMIGPKEQALSGNAVGGTLAPTLTLRNGEIAEMCIMDEVIVSLPGAANIGDRVYYDNTTGVLGSTADIATFTASQTTTVLTVTAITAGNLGVGSVVTQASGLQSIIQSLGTGTGGTGTYNVNTSQNVSSGAATATSVAPSGKTFVPGGRVYAYTVSGAGLAVLKLTN